MSQDPALASLEREQPNWRSPSVASSRTRSEGIDAVRFIAFCFIVALHARGTEFGSAYREALEVLPRFGVPFFFLVSGYFLKIEASTAEVIVRFLKRLLPIYVFWLAVYLVVHRVFYGDFGVLSVRGLIVMGQPAYHLWFLPSLGVSVVMVMVLNGYMRARYVILICLALYAIGLYFVEFSSPFGPGRVPWNFRDGPFFGSIFVALGYYGRKYAVKPSAAAAVSLIVAGLLVSLAERYALLHLAIITPASEFDYCGGTLIYGVGAAAAALNLPASGDGLSRLARLGRYALGFYCVHLLFLWALASAFPLDNLFNVLFTVTVTILGSILTILLLAKLPYMRRFIS